MRPIFDEKFNITDSFQGHVNAGGDRATFAGVDIGTPVGYYGFAPVSGRVNSFTDAPVGPDKKQALVCQFFPDDNPGLMLEFVHMSSYDKVSGRVNEGERIFITGNSGWTTGPHTHIAAVVNGVRVDPMPYINRYYYSLLGSYDFVPQVGEKYYVNKSFIVTRVGSDWGYDSQFSASQNSVFEIITETRPDLNHPPIVWVNGKWGDGNTAWLAVQKNEIVKTDNALTPITGPVVVPVPEPEPIPPIPTPEPVPDPVPEPEIIFTVRYIDIAGQVQELYQGKVLDDANRIYDEATTEGIVELYKDSELLKSKENKAVEPTPVPTIRDNPVAQDLKNLIASSAPIVVAVVTLMNLMFSDVSESAALIYQSTLVIFAEGIAIANNTKPFGFKKFMSNFLSYGVATNAFASLIIFAFAPAKWDVKEITAAQGALKEVFNVLLVIPKGFGFDNRATLAAISVIKSDNNKN